MHLMKITIVGSGNGGCAMAAFLAKRGFDVSILKLGSVMHTENFKVLRDQNKIVLSGIEGEGEFEFDQVSNDPACVIPHADLILVIYVSNYHKMVAERICPYLHEKQTVVLNPGYLGSMLFRKEMQRLGNNSQPLSAEFETLPFSSRILEPGKVWISSRNVRHPFATYPVSRTNEFIDKFASVLGECVPRQNLLEVALHNPNLIIHTIGVLMNVSLVENEEKPFAMYRDGFSKSGWNLVFKLDEEKMDVLEKIGAPRIPYFDEFRLRTFVEDVPDPFAAFKHYASEAPDGPFSVDHRYVTEDLPMGLGLLHSLGKLTNVPTPICDSLIHIANALLPNHDFWSEIRTVESLWEGSLEGLLKELKG